MLYTCVVSGTQDENFRENENTPYIAYHRRVFLSHLTTHAIDRKNLDTEMMLTNKQNDRKFYIYIYSYLS